MKSHSPLQSFPTVLCFLACSILLQFHPVSSNPAEFYETCGNEFSCGSITGIGYPFRGYEDPAYCGYPGLELRCDQSSNATRLEIQNMTYWVLDIHPTAQTLRVAREDVMENHCPTDLVNMTLDYTLFDYSASYINVTFLYGCQGNVPNVLFSCGNNSLSFPCTINNTTPTASFFLTSRGAKTNISQLPFLKTCTDTVRVPINQVAISILFNTAGLRAALTAVFLLQYKANNTFCTNCANSGGQCGKCRSSGGECGSYDNEFVCYCDDHKHLKTCGYSAGKNRSQRLRNVIGISAAGVLLATIIIISVVIHRIVNKKPAYRSILLLFNKTSKENLILEAAIKQYGSLAPRRYSYSNIKRMTSSFKDKLGEGGYGKVYKGNLFAGRPVAVKILNTSKGSGEEFINEVASISRTSHVNIVALLGFCFEGQKRALIYEFMPNGSLERYIHGETTSKTDVHLGWEKLYQIALGIARGLEYLHRGCTMRILHFDIKPHNILLDDDFCPKISDFGLAKLCSRKESVVSMLEARGTVGYIAPEVICRNFGAVSPKSDVYSYGMMLMEMVGGRKNISIKASHTSEIYFPHWAYQHMILEKDFKLHGVMTPEEDEIARKMVLVGVWCIQADPSQRPVISKVIEMLEGSLEALEIPPKPFFGSPSRSPEASSITIQSSVSHWLSRLPGSPVPRLSMLTPSMQYLKRL
ncbi:unnamed protein product [Coffea canephora]|uniref:non-specific serine/threonine protein kinase n=1 Tax=Coffea canephora TaxID=49390 RepID=A0A068UWZ9_COFCA|nr:unnamed protein product [Coffea canephora]